MRTQMNLYASYITTTDAATLITCSTAMQCTGNFNEVSPAVTTSRTFVRGTSNITAAVSAMTTAGNRDALTWEPGLVLAAKDQADYLATQKALSSSGSGGSTLTSR